MCHNIFNVICHQNIYFISPETTPELFCAIKRYRWDIELHLPAPFTLCPVGTMQNGGTKECRNGYLGSKSGSNIRPKCSNSVLCCGEKLVGWNQTFSWTHWVYGYMVSQSRCLFCQSVFSESHQHVSEGVSSCLELQLSWKKRTLSFFSSSFKIQRNFEWKVQFSTSSVSFFSMAVSYGQLFYLFVCQATPFSFN